MLNNPVSGFNEKEKGLDFPITSPGSPDCIVATGDDKTDRPTRPETGSHIRIPRCDPVRGRSPRRSPGSRFLASTVGVCVLDQLKRQLRESRHRRFHRLFTEDGRRKHHNRLLRLSLE